MLRRVTVMAVIPPEFVDGRWLGAEVVDDPLHQLNRRRHGVLGQSVVVHGPVVQHLQRPGELLTVDGDPIGGLDPDLVAPVVAVRTVTEAPWPPPWWSS
jgi:hypothetical protein